MLRAMRVCSCMGCAAHPGTCPAVVKSGRCGPCSAIADQRRGSARQRGYGRAHESRFRPGVLARDPFCVCSDEGHDHPIPCGRRSEHADHHPKGRDELVAAGLDPDDPRYGRGLCQGCHSQHTAARQPGGWRLL